MVLGCCVRAQSGETDFVRQAVEKASLSHRSDATGPKRAITLCKIKYTVIIMRDVPSYHTLTRDP